ncbi:methyltransferas-like protein [Lindgomyces ingoldianus]|uniref:Methyltransferas-like protein n=1 Tax=Lindgomyces ingoldianus TaxID=673940 RepID=A0ACB6QUP5_9PLEO|nr:methyltransferas-like protein [Lindgomyces ingoldianus]KAF2469790.1 methyltransferas-like protein [Lindgomyces ingoldianus]
MADGEWDGDFDPLADPDEQKHLLSVLDSFRSYRRLAHFNATHVRRQAFYSLPSEHWGLLSRPPFSILDSLSQLDDLIDSNAELAEAIFKVGFKAFIAPALDSEWVAKIVDQKSVHDEFLVYSTVMDHLTFRTTQESFQNDVDKARSTVHQFYRDWSVAGAAERAKCFDPVVNALEEEFAQRLKESPGLDKAEFKVLLPGTGLGRLLLDICRAGFSVEGNELSYHALIASSLVLNHTKTIGEYKIAPFALQCSNHLSRGDQFRTFQVPDIHPGVELEKASEGRKVPASERMSMAAGDFCVLYSIPSARDTVDAVATVFFIDTAPNIIRYIEAVKNCLKVGGIWINLGPLLWHHASRLQCSGEEHEEKSKSANKHLGAGIADPGSVELTDEEVVQLVEHFGFTIEKHETGRIETGYISNPESMLQNIYRPSFWIARKNDIAISI